MNKLFGGSQKKMRNTIIEDQNYLGPYDHPNKLKEGDTQHMSFQQGDAGPFWMTEDDQNKNMYDRELDEEIIYKNYTQNQLIKKIKESTNLTHVNGTFEEIQILAHQHSVPIFYEKIINKKQKKRYTKEELINMIMEKTNL